MAFVPTSHSLPPLSTTPARALSSRSSPFAGRAAGPTTPPRATHTARPRVAPATMTFRGMRPYRRGAYRPGTAFGPWLAPGAPLMRELLGEFFDEMRDPSAAFVPHGEVTETAKEYALRLEIPGFPKENVKVEVQKNMLVIRGDVSAGNGGGGGGAEEERGEEAAAEVRPEGSAEAEEIKPRWERSAFYSKFERSFRLPKNADVAAISASVKDGILIVTIPKKEPETPEKIPITIN